MDDVGKLSRAFKSSYQLAYSIRTNWVWIRFKSLDWGESYSGVLSRSIPTARAHLMKNPNSQNLSNFNYLRNPHVQELQCFILVCGNDTLFGATPQFPTDSVGPLVTPVRTRACEVRCELMTKKASYPFLLRNRIQFSF